jgi:hypothetical protein
MREMGEMRERGRGKGGEEEVDTFNEKARENGIGKEQTTRVCTDARQHQ